MLQYCHLNRTIVQISGKDSASFLQGLLTQDINLLTSENSVFTLLLNNKGRYLLDFFIIKYNNDLLIDIALEDVPLLEQTIKHYKLRAKVTATINNTLSVYAVFSTNPPISTDSNNTLVDNNNIIVADVRFPALGFRVITPNKNFWEETNAANIIKNYYNLPKTSSITLTEESEYIRLRYSLVVPENLELIKEKSIPLECGLDELNAISFNKGCYLGQEFTNASKRTLVIRKRLLTFKANTNLEEIYKEQQVATITSSTNDKIGTVIAIHKNYVMALVKIDSIKNNNIFFINNTKLEPIIPERLKSIFNTN